MATRNIVPRGNGEGQLGTSAKHWDRLFVDKINDGADLGNNVSLGYRQPNETVTAGTIRYHSALPTGYHLECTTAGITSEGDITPSSTIGDTVTDGTAVWTVTSNNTALHQNKPYRGDLDDLVTRGYCYYSATCTNKPDDNGGNLLSLGDLRNDNYIVEQIAFSRLSRSIYHRTKLIDGWIPWRMQESIVAKSLSSNGYIKYASGLIIQWGDTGSVINVAGVGLCMDVAFPIAFSTNTPQVVVATRNTAAQVSTDNGFGATILTDTLNANGFKAKKFNTKTGEVNYNGSMAWCAFGY